MQVVGVGSDDADLGVSITQCSGSSMHKNNWCALYFGIKLNLMIWCHMKVWALL